MEINFNCSSCSRESQNVIPVMRIIEKLDVHFSKNDLVSAGNLLEYWEREARNLGDERGLLEILNEEIGYFRRTNEREKGLNAVLEAFSLIDKLGCDEVASSATIYLNGATTMKAFGKTRNTIQYYEKAKNIFENTLSPNDYRIATYHNNVSAAYKELGEFEKAEKACYCALDILIKCGGYLGERAVTHINLAHIYYDIDPCNEQIYEHIDKAWELLMSADNTHDGSYAFICSKCYPSFGFFGYFEYEKELKALAESIYERN